MEKINFKNGIAALGVGFIFSLGLAIAGMTQPQKIVGFLDLFGNWDPSLMFVMIGAIGVHFVTYKLIRKKSSPLLSAVWHVPTKCRSAKTGCASTRPASPSLLATP